MNLTGSLIEIGFSTQEAKIYLYILKNGAQSQQAISDGTNILRQTVYDLMKKMESKGYVSSSLEGKRRLYQGIAPDILLEQIKEKEESFTQVLPDLRLLAQEQNVQISSQTFVGMKGLKNLFRLTLQSSTPILWLANKKIHDNIFTEYFWHNYAKKRSEKNIPIQLIIEPSADDGWKTSTQFKRETKRHSYLEELETSLIIFDDKVLLYTTQEDQLFGLFIQNKFMKDFFKSLFMKLWAESQVISIKKK